MSVVVVTGTDTGVGKTVATAALASAARLAGVDVAVCKPVQTGFADGDDDLAEVGRLSGVTALTPGWRYPEPLAPVLAARRAELPLPSGDQLLALVRTAMAPDRLVLVEGAGGLLVEIAADGFTLRDLAAGLGATVLVVARAGLGTLNHTALTVEALAAQGVSCEGVIVGSWPGEAGTAELDNRTELARLAPLRGLVPERAGLLDPEAFADLSAAAFDADWLRGL